MIAYEREDRAVISQLKEALVAGRRVTIPTVVVVETWRGGDRSARIAPLFEACVVESLGEALSRRAGELVAKVRGAGAIDSIVVASAATRRDVVVTSDPDDISRLAEQVSDVDVLAV